MHPEMFAVVSSNPCQNVYRFTKWHDSLESAKKEAERLAKGNDEKFYVLKVLGYAEIKSVEWVDF
jgi:hypothetical protein